MGDTNQRNRRGCYVFAAALVLLVLLVIFIAMRAGDRLGTKPLSRLPAPTANSQ